MNQRNRFGILLAILFVAALIFYWFSTTHSRDLVLVGTVDANQVTVSPKIMGRVEQLNVEEGQTVKAGDLIATLDSQQWLAQKRAAEATLASLRNQVASSSATASSTTGETINQVSNARATLQAAQATLAEAQANLNLQETNAKRTLALAQQGIVSQQDRDEAENSLAAQRARVEAAREQVEAAKAALDQAIARTSQGKAAEKVVAATRAQMDSAQAQLAEAEIELGYTKIYSPINGKVYLKVAREGEVVNPGAPIVVLIDLTQTWVYAPLPETYGDTVELGDQLKVRMPSGATLGGKVIAKSALADFATQRDVGRMKRDIKAVQLKLLIDNPKMEYVPGMTAEVLVSPEMQKRVEARKQ